MTHQVGEREALAGLIFFTIIQMRVSIFCHSGQDLRVQPFFHIDSGSVSGMTRDNSRLRLEQESQSSIFHSPPSELFDRICKKKYAVSRMDEVVTQINPSD
jgi:hypothetical protein